MKPDSGGLPRVDPALLEDLRNAVAGPRGVRIRAADRLAMANDASHYLLVPQAVVTPNDAAEVGALFGISQAHKIPLTFRSGGTSLSGQAVTAGLLVDVRSRFRQLQVLADGARIRVQPGVTLRAANSALAPYGHRIGPDPASETACTVGGVVANNSSGMTCGTAENAYRTLHAVTIVLPSGTVVDTSDPAASSRLKATEPELWEGLSRLRDRVRNDPDAVRLIQRQFAMKNTMGYALNSLLDYTDPVDILAHLIVGSEGTLGFIADVVLNTVPLRPNAAAGMMVFESLSDATSALPDLVGSGAAAVELLDARSLRTAQAAADVPRSLCGLDVRQHAALLVEYQHADAEGLGEILARSQRLLAPHPTVAPIRFSTDAAVRSSLWRMRKGLYAIVAGARRPGTVAILEDVVVPVPELARASDELTGLLNRHGYADAVIFGHAKDGNLHFMITDSFDDPSNVERYDRFTDEMVDLILSRGGSLKAEHGTGRNMAPYLKRQYGDEMYAVMEEIKDLFDPTGLLNSGVLLNQDPLTHLKNLKTAPEVGPEVDSCVECGYCEPVCPSRDLTTTPRQRIVLRRAVQRAVADGSHQLADELIEDFEYDGLQTCAADGMCQTACPVGINTGDLVKRLRGEEASTTKNKVWHGAARHWRIASSAASAGLSLAAAVPPAIPRGATQLGRRVLGQETIPSWSDDLPSGGPRRSTVLNGQAPGADVIYFPSCTSAMFGPAGAGVTAAFAKLCERAGIGVRLPAEVDHLCCGTPWRSKGMVAGYEEMQRRVAATIQKATDGGTIPLVCDASSCTEGLQQLVAHTQPSVTVVDAVSYVADVLLPRLPGAARVKTLALHPTCSSTRLNLNAALRAIAAVLAEEVIVPQAWGCCGFAGDRGLLHPELTASATFEQAAELQGSAAEAFASCNRTCEIGMSRATGQPYRHIVELLAESLPDP